MECVLSAELAPTAVSSLVNGGGGVAAGASMLSRGWVLVPPVSRGGVSDPTVGWVEGWLRCMSTFFLYTVASRQMNFFIT